MGKRTHPHILSEVEVPDQANPNPSTALRSAQGEWDGSPSDNACHATAEKRIKNEGFAPVLWLKTKRQPDAMEIRIEDNGMGMTPQVMGKIFNPFFTTKQPTEGTGLGLSLSHDIVRQHGGTITPASEPGEYTEMTITLPL